MFRVGRERQRRPSGGSLGISVPLRAKLAAIARASLSSSKDGVEDAAQDEAARHDVRSVHSIPRPQPRPPKRGRSNQPKISALANFKLDGFSVQRLMTFLTALDQDVQIVIRIGLWSRRAGRISVLS